MIAYDFTDAEQRLREWGSPSELSANLKDKALHLVAFDDASKDMLIKEMQLAVLDVCDFLDTIKPEQ